ncbi:MAG: alpha/beta hydrolase, partial [Planctomycetota bacterium]
MLFGFGVRGGIAHADGPTFFKDVRYAEGTQPEWICDVRLPTRGLLENDRGESPVVVIVHGGAWSSGDKWTMGNWSVPLSKQGFACVAINYRHAPEHPYPAQVDDVRRALAWLPRVAKRFQFDTSRIGLVGYSAGAHLATLTATSANSKGEQFEATSGWSFRQQQEMKVPAITAVVGGGTPAYFLDIPPTSQLYSYWFGDSPARLPTTYKLASPIEHLDGDDPPTLLVHGDADLMVAIENARRMIRQAEQCNAPV